MQEIGSLDPSSPSAGGPPRISGSIGSNVELLKFAQNEKTRFKTFSSSNRGQFIPSQTHSELAFKEPKHSMVALSRTTHANTRNPSQALVSNQRSENSFSN